jgi:signal transduction histidine kinase
LIVYDERERPRYLRRADTAATWALDVGIAFLTLIPTVAVLGHGFKRGAHGAVSEVLVGALLSVAPLIVRRRWPVQVLAFILIVGVAVPGPAVFSPPALVALYTVASRRPWRLAVAGTIATVIASPLHLIVWGYNLPLFAVISEIALAMLALVLGLYQATRLAYLQQLQQRTARLEREQVLLAEQAAADERLRIARELHDVVAHNVSLMVVQAQALAATAGSAGPVHDSAHAIAELGRGAMSEMHRTLELMRPSDGGGESERAPQPTLAGLGALIERARSAGVSVELSVDGPHTPIGAWARRHAGARSAVRRDAARRSGRRARVPRARVAPL